MIDANYVGRFARHGAKLAWRVGLILAGVAGVSLVEAAKSVVAAGGAADSDEAPPTPYDEYGLTYYDRFYGDKVERGIWDHR